jgi:hypothetical protein
MPDRDFTYAREVVRRYEKELDQFVRKDLADLIRRGDLDDVLRARLEALAESEDFGNIMAAEIARRSRPLLIMSAALLVLVLGLTMAALGWFQSASTEAPAFFDDLGIERMEFHESDRVESDAIEFEPDVIPVLITGQPEGIDVP